MNFYIYLIHNILNNKVYIGKAKEPIKRWQKHIRIAAGKRQKEKFYIHRAITGYGVNNFIFSILQKFDNEIDCGIAEIYWIQYFQSKNSKYGYNLTKGGEGVSGRIMSETTKQKIREKAIGRKHTDETKEKLKIINLGKRPSNLEQLKIINTGKSLSEMHKKKISKARKGIIFTNAHKQNMSKARAGIFVGNKNPFYGKTHTEESKEKSRGENNKQSKLTTDKVLDIIFKYKSGNFSQQQLADQYGVSRKAIDHILHGRTWAHLLKEIK